jgi:hypothetical protein
MANSRFLTKVIDRAAAAYDAHTPIQNSFLRSIAAHNPLLLGIGYIFPRGPSTMSSYGAADRFHPCFL